MSLPGWRRNGCGIDRMMRRHLKAIWQGVRCLSGEDAYERYLTHWREHQPQAGNIPLDRKAFYRQYLDRKWNGVRRCC